VADVKFTVTTESTKALNDFSKLTIAQQKMDLETKKLNNSLQRQSQQFAKSGKSAAKAGSSPSLTSYVPGGGGAEQFKQTLGALGITGLAGAVLSLKNAIDANTQAALDRAKDQRDLSRKIGPTDFFQGKDPRFQGEFQKNRNTLAQDTGTPLEEIDKLNSSFSAIVTSAEDLNNVIQSIAIASKLNLGSMEELIRLEQNNISKGGAAGNAVSDLTTLNTLTNGAAQVKDILDEISSFKNQNTGFAVGAKLIKSDAYNAESNMKLLSAFQEKGSNANLRSYMRIGEEVEGDEMFAKFSKFIDSKASKLGMSKETVVDSIVKQGDLDAATGDALKTMLTDIDSLNYYLDGFTKSTNTSQTALKSIIKTFEELKNSNVTFKQAFEEDQSKVDAEIKNASTGPTLQSEAFTKQQKLNEKAITKGMDTVLSKDTNGLVKDSLWNRLMLADEKVPFVTNATAWREGAKERLDKNYLKVGKEEYGFLDAAELVKDEIGMVLTKPSAMASKGLDKVPWLKEMLSFGANDIPLVGGAVTYGQTGKILPGKYKTKDEQGNIVESFSLGGLGQLGLDVASLGVGGVLGKRVGNNAAKKALTKSSNLNKSVSGATDIMQANVKSNWLQGQFSGEFGSFLQKEFATTVDDKITKLTKVAQDVTKQTDKYIEKINTPVPFTRGLNMHQTVGVGSGIVGGSGLSHIGNETFASYAPIRSDTEAFVNNSIKSGSRNNIDVYQPGDWIGPGADEQNKLDKLNASLDLLVDLTKQNVVVNTTIADENKKIKEQLFNNNKKPFIRNSVR